MTRLIAAAALLMSSPAAAAVNLVSGGDFETATGALNAIPFWTASGFVVTRTGSDYSGCCQTFGSAPGFAGNQFASISGGDYSGLNTLSQSVATVAGQAYILTFRLGALASRYPRATTLSLGALGDFVGTTYAVAGNPDLDTTFGVKTVAFTANSATTLLAFTTVSAPDGIDSIVDDVSVVAATVPEPGSWALLLGGFALTGVALRRRTAPDRATIR